MADVKLEAVSKNFLNGKVIAVNDVTLEISDGKFVTILGPSGCGKSTLLRLIAGLELPDTGDIYIGQCKVTKVSPRKRNVSMVFQNYALYPHMTIRDNISFGMRMRGSKQEEIKQNIYNTAALLSIQDMLDRYPSQLSGGQKQRTALARAIVRKPSVFLLDEPLSNLDAALRDEMRTELKKLFMQLNATVIYVTHDQIEAISMSDIIVIMEKGIVRQIGEPSAIYALPANIFVAEFVGNPRINLIPGKIEHGKFTSADGFFCIDGFKGSLNALLGIRPESLKIIGNANITDNNQFILNGKVIMQELLGAYWLLNVEVGKNLLRVLTNDRPRLHDKKIRLFFNFEDVHLFDKDKGTRQ